jgi:parallel beta-helix repeat protein
MVCSRIIFFFFILFVLIVLSGIGIADPLDPKNQVTCMILVTKTTGGSVQPEGSITIPYGSDLHLTITPDFGYMTGDILVDEISIGAVEMVNISMVIHDMTVHAVFTPDTGTMRVPSTPVERVITALSSPQDAIPGPAREQNGTCPGGTGCTQGRIITVGAQGTDYTRIPDALAHASPGDTISIRNGTYIGELNISFPLSLTGMDGGINRPVISAGTSGPALTISADHVIIQNLSITGERREAFDGTEVVISGASDILIKNCLISDATNGIHADHGDNISITGSVIRDLSDTGILLSSQNRVNIEQNTVEHCRTGIRGNLLTGLSLVGNEIRASTHHGISLRGGLKDATIAGNTFSGNSYVIDPGADSRENGGLSLEYADNVTIAGNTLTHNGGVAITMHEAIHTIMTNNTLFGNQAGFSLTGNNPDPDNRIDSSNTVDGLPIAYFEGISGQTIKDITPSVLYLQNCSDIEVLGLTLDTRNGYGIMAKGGRNISVTNCSVSQNIFQNVLFAMVHGGNMSGCHISNNTGYGIGLTDSHDMVISGNQVTGNGIGIALRGDTTGILVNGNALSGNAIGFQLEETGWLPAFGECSDNRITGGKCGISSSAGGSGKILRNLVAGMPEGINLTGSYGLTIEENNIESVHTGIKIQGSGQGGMASDWRPCFGNSVLRNHVSAGFLPVDLDTLREQVFGNSFVLNDFLVSPVIGDTKSPDIPGYPLSWGGVSMGIPSSIPDFKNRDTDPAGRGNAWDTGKQVRYFYGNATFSGRLGNHWSSYTGTEIGTSGIGDVPYRIDEDNTDTYPLMGSQNRYMTNGSGYHLDLQEGWNFISTPSVLVSGEEKALIFSQVDTSGHSLYTYRNTTWIPVQADDPILPLHGYWIYAGVPSKVPLSFDPGTIPVPVHLTRGWNAIGYPGIQQATASDALSSLDASWSYVVGYNASMQTYETPIRQESGGNEMMYPSQGYWLYQNQEWDLQPVTG